jgi:hypothetical protein
MLHHLLQRSVGLLPLVALLLLTADTSGASKTIRVDHGRPVVVVSQKQVLVIEFTEELIKDALIPHDKPNIDHCRAKYRFKLLDAASGSITNGEGFVEEIYETVSRSATGSMVEDRGSKTHISAGEFGLSWSKASPGARSWLYYSASSGIRFIQQPLRVPFTSMDRAMLERYRASRNVAEIVAAGQTVHVIGPAVFAGDLPTEMPTSARIESAHVRDGTFQLKLSHLSTNKHYVIDSSYELKSGSWNAVHTFIARESAHDWKDPLGKDVNVMFYRIREAAY